MIARKRSVGVGVALLALVAACASTAERRPTAPRVEPSALDRVRWDAATGRLGCAGGYADLTLAPELRARVHVIAPDLVVVVLPQVNSALMVTVSPSSLRGKRAGVLGDLPEILEGLHRQATGVDLRDGRLPGHRPREGRPDRRGVHVRAATPAISSLQLARLRAAADPNVGLAFDASRAPQWRLVYREVGRCRIAAVDRGAPGDPPRLTPLLDELRVVPELITK